MYQIINEGLRHITESNESVIPNSTLYVRQINHKWSLVINSFQNKLFLIENANIKHQKIIVPKSKAQDFFTPKINPNYFDKHFLYQNPPKKGNNSIYIALAITYDCNLHCSYCFQQKFAGLQKVAITEQDLLKILQSVSSYQTDKNIQLGLFGGEPLLPQNEKLIDIVLSFCVRHKLFLDITTNGVFLPYFAKKLIVYRSIISVISITVNSLPDKYRQVIKISKVANNVKNYLV